MLQEKLSIEMNRRKQTFCSKAGQPKFKIILVGDSNVGKTSLFLAFTDDDLQDPQEKNNPSVTAVDFRLQPLQIQGEIIKLHIWDTAGQQRYRSIVESFFKSCQGAIIVFDLSSKKSFLHATNQWFKMCTNQLDSSEIILVGNKADLQHQISDQQIREWSLKQKVSYFQISVKNAQNVDEPFVQISKKMVSKKRTEIKAQLFSQMNKSQNLPKISEESHIKLNDNKKIVKKKGCC